MERIILLHTNDFHSHLENWPRLRRYVLAQQAEARATGSQPLTFDLGDAMDRVHPLTEATNGQFNVELLNQLHYDGVTIGNNEGIGNAKDQLLKLYQQANFPVILGNLYDPDTKQLASFAQPWLIITTEQGTRIGILGLTAAFPATYQPLGWQIKRATDVLPALMDQLSPQVDFVVLLSHLGLPVDRFLAQKFPEIAIIIGSHTHHLLPTGERQGTTLLAAAGKFGQYIGKISLTIDSQHHLQTATATVQATAELPVLANDAAEIAGYQQRGVALLSQQHLAQLPQALTSDPHAPNAAIKVCLAAIQQAAQADCAILNSGLFLSDLPQGVVTANDLHQQLPHPMHVIAVKLTGADLWRLAMEIEKNRHFVQHFPLKGMSFRGKIYGELVLRDWRIDPVNRQVWVQQQLIQPEQTYTLATVDNFMFIPFFPTVAIKGQVEFLMPDFLRNIFGHYLQQHYPLSKES
ncbi:bifunctional metallophosphatase/5'-nucleotidase [Lapidilactobacillus wuchangensis]|uniref:bifunctional metallophosphatase/5'-nucleotidase n=1 Tax=Lapidilactobacillus wuchangensis TaxID=2486001 RepID=UPI000F77255C|nr:bifunctional metallophosphatase/5'-nucleotidase [Lapidilactobacillus wuchangensis]